MTREELNKYVEMGDIKYGEEITTERAIAEVYRWIRVVVGESYDYEILTPKVLDKVIQALEMIDKIERFADIPESYMEFDMPSTIEADKESEDKNAAYCSDCIHHKVCGNEEVDYISMTFCAEKQTDEDLISRDYTIQQIQKAKESNYNFNYNTLIDFIKVLPSADKQTESEEVNGSEEV